jgi:V-type H+-transporting ATPase subunit C
MSPHSRYSRISPASSTPIPLQTGTLESLISLSEDLPKQDAYFTSVLAKIIETLRNLLNNDPAKLAQHIQVNDTSPDDYLLGRGHGGWKWNEARYGLQRGLREISDLLHKVPLSLTFVIAPQLTLVGNVVYR